MKKPAKAAHPAKGIVPPAAKAKAAQPGNAPGRGKAAHARPGPAKAAPKKIPPKPKVSAKVKARRHAAAVKASKTRAANARKAKQHPRRQLALGEGVACCSAEALAASLRLTGWPVSDADVLALYRRTAADLDAGASILATLEAAAEYGLAGVRLLRFGPAEGTQHLQDIEPLGWPGDTVSDIRPPADADLVLAGGAQAARASVAELDQHLCGGLVAAVKQPLVPGVVGACHGVSLILGLALPAPHAVLDTGSEWITWGQAWPARTFPDAELEEAWTIEWEASGRLAVTSRPPKTA